MNFISATQIIPYAAMAVILAASLLGGGFCVFFAVTLIRRQIRLTRSIILVELQSGKMLYLLFLAVAAAMTAMATIALCGGNFFEKQLLTDAAGYGMAGWQATIALVGILILSLSAGFLLCVLLLAKSAATDLGIYTALNFFGWYYVRDYVIDEGRSVVLIGTKKEAFSAIKGVMLPLHVKRNDIPKLKFILNKNKNKFTV